jgi:PAS domain S-box-containing protein
MMKPDGTILDANLFFSSRFESLHEHITGCNVFDLLIEINAPQEVIANRRLKTDEVLRTGRHVTFDDPMDGDIWRSSIYPVFSSDRQIQELLVIVKNVTAERLAEIENEDFRAKMDYALESSHVSVWSLDLEKNIVTRTQEHDRIFGYDTLLPLWTVKTFFDHLYPEDLPMVSKHYEVSMATKSDFNLECRIRRADGEIRWINLVGTYRFAKSETTRYVVGIVADITDKKRAALELEQLQAQLQQSQKMELLGQLAGGIAHDFNNSLTAIIGNIELALAKIDPNLPFAENLRDAHKSALRSTHLIKQLLGFARKQLTMPKAISLNQETESLIPMIRRLIRAQINLFWFPCKDDPKLFIDPAQLDQILSNLCINASDAIDETGTITVSSSTIHIEPEDCAQGHPCQIPGDYAVISVNDTGNGIDKTALPHIFEPFFTTKPPGKGTGLGLSTVYGIVRQNRGHIDCQSEPGKGTTFTVYFPRHRDNTVVIESGSSGQTTETAAGTVLLVEDEPNILKILKEALEENGFEVLSALDAETAIFISDKHKKKIDLLITDIILPQMTGIELSRKLNARIPDIKSLFMSAFAFEETNTHEESFSPVNFIRKPFTINDFMTMVRQVLHRE